MIITLPLPDDYTTQFYLLKTPYDSCVFGYSLKDLCKKYALRVSSMQLVLDGKHKTHRGYSIMLFTVPRDFIPCADFGVTKMNIIDTSVNTF